MWSDVCFIISETQSVDDCGDPFVEVVKKEIFCKVVSVGQSEFYQAMATGLKPEMKIKVNRFEYDNEKKVEYDGHIYDVIRTYSKGEDILEITLGGGINGTT